MAVTQADFNRIWASTSPLKPYSFSESKYKEGWNFIGSTPPSRQMWDFLQKRNDEKAQWLYSNKLSLSGGTMTGKLQFNGLAIPIELLITGASYRDIQTFSTDGNHRIGLIRMEKDSSNNCRITIGASNTSNDAPSGITITRGTSGSSVITGITPPADDNSAKIATTAFVNAKAGNYLPLSGGKLTGAINTANNTWNKLGDDASFGDRNVSGKMCIKTQTSTNTGIAFFNQSDTNVGQVEVNNAFDFDKPVKENGGFLVPIGVVQAFAGSTIPTGWLLCDGSAVSRTTYASLYACIGTTYGSGDGSTTFNLPNLTDKFIQGSGTVGTVKAAGLPNITGSIGGGAGTGGPAGNGSGIGFLRDTMINGCFQPKAYGNDTGVGGGTVLSGYPVLTANLDASRSSSVYGNSTTVQPPALTMRYIIKY